MKAIIYFIGVLILTAGIAYGLMAAGMPQIVVVVAALIVGGLGIMATAKNLNTSTKVTKTHADSAGRTSTSETEISQDAA